MTYIKAKYKGLIRPYMSVVRQGFGSVYGGNQVSDVTSENSRALDGQVGSTSTGSMFVGSRLFSYVNVNNGDELIFTNESSFIVSQSDGTVTEIETQRALEFINDSDWAPASAEVIIDPVDTLIEALQARAEYFENETATRELLNQFKNCF